MPTSTKKLVKRLGIGDVQYSFHDVIQTIGHSVREYKKPAILTPIFVTGEVVLECVLPLVTALLIDAINLGGGMGAIAHYSVVLICMALASLFFGTVAGITCSEASAGLAKNLRQDIFHQVQKFSFSNIDRFSTSSLVTRLTTDVNNVQQAYMMIIRTAIRSPMMLVFAIIMAFITAGPMAVIYVVMAIFLGFFLFLISIKVMPIFRRIFRKYDRLNDSVEENVSGIRVVKSFVREDYEKKKFDKASGTLYHDFVHVERILAWNQPVMTIAVDTIYAFVIYFGSKAVIISQGQLMGLGQISALITYGFSVLISLMMLSMIFVMITMSIESSQRITEVLKETSDISNPKDPIMKVPDGRIDFDHVSFKYSANASRMALSNVNLHIRSGETIGIIGGTGSSKSTLIQLVSRLYDTTEGAVSVGGHDVRDYDLDTLRGAVAVVLQRNVLFSGTIKDNLRWGNKKATDEQMLAACKLAQADEFIQRMPKGYDTYIEQGGTNVSGGQKQRLSIARVFLKNPPVLIFDEATSALDNESEKVVQESLEALAKHRTTFVIAHRLSTIKNARRILVLAEDGIVEEGSHEELVARDGVYAQLYRLQFK